MPDERLLWHCLRAPNPAEVLTSKPPDVEVELDELDAEDLQQRLDHHDLLLAATKVRPENEVGLMRLLEPHLSALRVPAFPVIPLPKGDNEHIDEGRVRLLHPLVPRPPFLACLIGPTDAGKTTVIINMLMQNGGWRGFFDEIVIISPTVKRDSKWELINTTGERFDHWDEEVEHELEAVLKKGEMIAEGAPTRHVLFILDDFIGQGVGMTRNSFFGRLSTRYRWSNCSIIFSGQKMTELGPLVRNNATHFMIWPTKSGREITTLEHELRGTLPAQSFRRLLLAAWREPHSFLTVERKAPPQSAYRRCFEEILVPDLS
jgi:hypothetical protein